MSAIRFCACPEENADYGDFVYDNPDPRHTGTATNAHMHDGCRVFHKGMTCTMEAPEPPQMELF